jgi:16S rRNA (guanine966-N2)-methyltransferase
MPATALHAHAKTMKKQNHFVRIIGGKWRSRKVTFANIPELRPTTDRVRETLFNWLMTEMHDTTCLELYAGSGVLSLEALSRGARHVTIVEHDARAIASLQENFKKLLPDDDQYTLHRATVSDWISSCSDSFDIIFIDPPFNSLALRDLCKEIARKKIARKFVYLEAGEAVKPEDLPFGWSILRHKRAGTVHYCLCETG